MKIDTKQWLSTPAPQMALTALTALNGIPSFAHADFEKKPITGIYDMCEDARVKDTTFFNATYAVYAKSSTDSKTTIVTCRHCFQPERCRIHVVEGRDWDTPAPCGDYLPPDINQQP